MLLNVLINAGRPLPLLNYLILKQCKRERAQKTHLILQILQSVSHMDDMAHIIFSQVYV